MSKQKAKENDVPLKKDQKKVLKHSLFIDTNIYLKFFSLNKEQIDNIKDIEKYIKRKRITLYVTEHLKEEFHRNRENKLFEILEPFVDDTSNLSTLPIIQQSSFYKDLKDKNKAFVKSKKKLVSDVLSKIRDNNFYVDKLILSLFGLAKVINTTDEIIAKARKRMDLKNPPGKNNSLGDAIHWESLLQENITDTMVIVSSDGDFFSRFNDKKFLQGGIAHDFTTNTFLLREWLQKKNSKKIFSYKNLKTYFSKHNLDVIAPEMEVIEGLEALEQQISRVSDPTLRARYLKLLEKVIEIPNYSIVKNTIHVDRRWEKVIMRLKVHMLGEISRLITLNSDIDSNYYVNPKAVN